MRKYNGLSLKDQKAEAQLGQKKPRDNVRLI